MRYVMALAALAPAPGVSPAWAAAPLTREAEAEVRRLVDAAQVDRAAGRYDEAIGKLRAALALHPAPWLFFNLGRVNEVAGRHDLARRHFELAATAEDDAETRRKALEGMKRVDERGPRGLMRLTVRLPDGAGVSEGAGAARPDGAEEAETVRVDGFTWEARLGRTFNLARGTHLIEVTREGFAPWSQQVEVDALTELDAHLAPSGLAAPAPSAPAPSASAPAATPELAPTEAATDAVMRATGTKPAASALDASASGTVGERPTDGAAGFWPWTVAGLGGAVAVTGGIYLVGWQLDWQKVQDGDGVTWRDEAEALVSSGRDKRDLGIPLVAVGGSVLLGGLLWGLLADGDAPAMVLPAGPGGPGVSLGGRF